MSGVRASDTELMALGLTLPGFVERSEVVASLPSLGLLTLAALTHAAHQIEYIEIPDISQLESLPSEFDLVAISSYSAQIGQAYELARRYHDAGTPVVMGGPHVTALPAEALVYCDAVVAGEGEPMWQAVLADCEAGKMKGVYDSRPLHYDLAESPVPAYELLDISNYNRLTVQTSRGCPHRCEFCGSSVLLTRGYKQKPVANVIREIETIQRLWKHPFLEFADDNAFVHKEYWKELLTHLPPKRMRWFAETDLTVAEDEQLLSLMRKRGCAQVLIGFESPVEAGLQGIELKNDWKHKRFPQYRDAIRTIQSHGITVNGCFVLGLDGQTPEVFDEVYDFVRDTELFEVQITVLTPFPGTPLLARLEQEERILEPGRWEMCSLFDINFRPSHMSVSELANGFRELGVRLYSDEFTNWRRSNYKKHLKPLKFARGGANE